VHTACTTLANPTHAGQRDNTPESETLIAEIETPLQRELLVLAACERQQPAAV
jgi:hypothetical protein